MLRLIKKDNKSLAKRIFILTEDKGNFLTRNLNRSCLRYTTHDQKYYRDIIDTEIDRQKVVDKVKEEMYARKAKVCEY